MRKTVSGFTITELVVAISIIGIIFAFSAVSFLNIQANSRDTERSSKASILAEYLEKYYEKNGEYPNCSEISGNPDTVKSSVLPGIDPEVLTTPSAEADNSIACEELSEFVGANDVFAYTGDDSDVCLSGGACNEFTLQYLEERSGSIKTIESRHKVASIGAPSVTAESSGTSQISVSWTAVGGASSYSIGYDTSETFDNDPQTSSTSNTNIDLTGLSVATTYYVRVAGIANGQQGPWSTTTNATTDTPSIGSLILTVNSNSQITASWDAVDGASSYTLERSTSSSYTSPTTVNTASTSSIASSLNHGQRYYFRLNATINGSPTDWQTANATTPISAPGSVDSSTSSSTAISVTWGSVTNAQSYTLQYSTSSGFSGATSISSLTGTSTSVTGLSQGIRYYFRLQAIGANASSSWSSSTDSITSVNTPSTPSASAAYTTSTRAWNASNWVYWDNNPNSSISNWYYVQLSLSGSSCASGTTREFRARVRMSSTGSYGPWTSWVTATTRYSIRNISSPTSSAGVRFAVEARCVGTNATSSTSSTASACAWYTSSSTSCTNR